MTALKGYALAAEARVVALRMGSIVHSLDYKEAP